MTVHSVCPDNQLDQPHSLHRQGTSHGPHYWKIQDSRNDKCCPLEKTPSMYHILVKVLLLQLLCVADHTEKKHNFSIYTFYVILSTYSLECKNQYVAIPKCAGTSTKLSRVPCGPNSLGATVTAVDKSTTSALIYSRRNCHDSCAKTSCCYLQDSLLLKREDIHDFCRLDKNLKD